MMMMLRSRRAESSGFSRGKRRLAVAPLGGVGHPYVKCECYYCHLLAPQTDICQPRQKDKAKKISQAILSIRALADTSRIPDIVSEVQLSYH